MSEGANKMNTEFVDFHKPCPVCNSSDACSVNEDGSAKCFSCESFFPNYEEATTGSVVETKQPTESFVSSYTWKQRHQDVDKFRKEQ